MASASNQFRSHEEFRRAKELEEARKAGIAPAAVDEETGKEINPHIPQYMSTAPWYLNENRPTLKHQKNWKQQLGDSKAWYDRGAKVFQATKWRKGACENCGAITHKTKDCLERPRSKGAKWTNKHIAADEKIQNINIEAFDAKRDRWNGFEADQYAKVVDRYEELEQLRMDVRKEQELKERFTSTDADGEAAAQQDGADEFRDEDKIVDEEEAGFGKVEKRVRTTAGGATGSVRNLRIREDTAKYLLNLDPNSAHYDPKSRSMREDPQPYKDPSQKTFMGDNFVRQSGDYHAWQALNQHAVQAYEAGQDVHNVAVPSAAAIMFTTQQVRQAQVAVKSKKSVLEKYGSAGQKPPEDITALAQSEAYVEYDAAGRVVKGQEIKASSRYPEDVYINNHTSVWGSWWCDGQWGFACCHQSVRNSYCTGKVGEEAAAAAAQQMVDNMEARQREADARSQREADARSQQEADARRAAEAGSSGREGQGAGYQPHGKGVWGSEVDGELQLDEEKIKAAIKAQREAARAAEEGEGGGDERKRKYNSLADNSEVTPEDMEAYRLIKARGEDPMLAFKKGDKADGGYDYV